MISVTKINAYILYYDYLYPEVIFICSYTCILVPTYRVYYVCIQYINQSYILLKTPRGKNIKNSRIKIYTTYLICSIKLFSVVFKFLQNFAGFFGILQLHIYYLCWSYYSLVLKIPFHSPKDMTSIAFFISISITWP